MSDAAADFRLEGTVTFGNLIALRSAGEKAIAAAGEHAVVDVSGLQAGNSLAVALLMAWFRAAEQAGKAVSFVGVRDDLRRIIDLSGMSDILPLAADGERRREVAT